MRYDGLPDVIVKPRCSAYGCEQSVPPSFTDGMCVIHQEDVRALATWMRATSMAGPERSFKAARVEWEREFSSSPVDA